MKGDKSHHKDSFNLIQGMAVPAGWTPRELELAATVARYHRGVLPHLRSKALQKLDRADRQMAGQLSAVLRLANRLDFRNGADPSLHVDVRDRVVTVHVAGYRPLEQDIAAAGHLLETVLRRPVVVTGMRVAGSERRVASRQ